MCAGGLDGRMCAGALGEALGGETRALSNITVLASDTAFEPGLDPACTARSRRASG
jgi:hypothetical protein